MSLTEEEEIAQWEEILKERYTTKDMAYVEHVAKPRKGPPVVEQWFPRGMNRKRPARRDDRGYGGGDRGDRGYGGGDRGDRGYGGGDRGYGGGDRGERRPRYDGAGPPEKRRAYNDYNRSR